jgi:hypothetical protein
MNNQPPPNEIADFVVMFITLTLLAVGLISVAWGKVDSWRARRGFLSSYESDDTEESNNPIAENSAFLSVKGNGETTGNGVAIGETERNDPFQFPDLFTGLARLVLDKKIGETEAIKLAIKAAPGKSDRYQEARRRLHAAMEREQPGGAQFMQDDGSRAPATYPVSGRRAAS